MTSEKRQVFTFLLLRIGVAFSFLYPAIAGLVVPNSWIGYFPGFLRDNLPSGLLLPAFSLVQIVIALWILYGKKLLLPTALASLLLMGIIIQNFAQFDVIFRDVAILASSIVLLLNALPKKAE